MDRLFNTKVDKQLIYEIYRSCRLCGAGAGYKMPIIQNVIAIDGEDVELRQKIRECVQIEVNQDDKMPPLICELCVDKVNDFYVFLEMCRQTNKRTRKRLGLPMPTTKKGSVTSDNSDCILGVTEPVYLNEDSNEPLSRSSPRNSKVKGPMKKKEVKVEITRDSRITKGAKPMQKRPRSPSPPSPRTTRHSRGSNEDNQSLSSIKQQSKKSTAPPPKSILKRESILRKDTRVSKVEEKSLRSKRTLEPPKPVVPQKRVKMAVKPPPKPEVKPAPGIKCSICRFQSKTYQANSNHMKSHTVNFTNEKLACNACREWFSNADDAAAHHKRHKARSRPYKCRGCNKSYDSYAGYRIHTGPGVCVPWTEVPDVQCPVCYRSFPTNNLREAHKCLGPGGKCSKCGRTYTLLKSLKKHESTCTAKKKEYNIDPALLSKLTPIQIRVSRCDPLLDNEKDGHYDVSTVEQDYGLDVNSVYPYIHSASLNFNRMVNIKSELDFYCEENYVHWDSDDVSSDDDVTDNKRLLPLSTLALKILFSQKCLGRVPRKKRRVKAEKSVFDSIMNTDFDMSKDIDSIIDNLGDDDHFDNSDAAADDKNDSSNTEDENNIAEECNKDVENKKNAKDNENESSNTFKENNNKDTDKPDGPIDLHNKPDEENNLFEIEKTNESNEKHEETNTKSEESERVKKVSDENMSENLTGSTNIDDNDTTDAEITKDIRNDTARFKDLSNDAETSKDISINHKVEPSVEKARDIIDDSTKTNTDEERSAEKDNPLNETHIERNISTERDSCVSESKNTDSVSKSLGKDKDTVSIQEDQAKKEKINDIINDKIEESVTKDKDNSEISKHPENQQDTTKSEDLSDTANDSLNNIQHVEDNIDDTENFNDSSKNSEHVKDNEQSSKIKDKAITNNDVINSSESNDVTSNYDKTDNGNNDTISNEAAENNEMNGDVEEKSDKLNMDDFHDTCDTEIDDKKLMDDLNEHIGDELSENNDEDKNDDNGDVNDEVATDYKNDKNANNDGVIEKAKAFINDEKITLDDLMTNKVSDTPSMDLDSISDDDFDFNS